MVQMIMELVRSGGFALSVGGAVRGGLRRLRGGLPQGSALAPLLFGICACDLPSTVSRGCACADGLALMRASGDLGTLEGTLRHDNTFSVFPDLEAEAQPH